MILKSEQQFNIHMQHRSPATLATKLVIEKKKRIGQRTGSAM